MIDILALRAASLPARRAAGLALALAAAAALAACQQGSGPANVPGNAQDNHPYDGIDDGEVLHFTGTEPFWGGQAKGSVLTYTTPENPDGETITVARFAGLLPCTRGALEEEVTLTHNLSNHYECRWVTLQTTKSRPSQKLLRPHRKARLKRHNFSL